MNGTGSLTQRAWVEAAVAHSRLDTFEGVYVEQQATIRRDISNVQTDVEKLQASYTQQGDLMRNAIDSVKTDIGQKVGGLYSRIWRIVGVALAAQSTAIVWLANKAFRSCSPTLKYHTRKK